MRGVSVLDERSEPVSAAAAAGAGAAAAAAAAAASSDAHTGIFFFFLMIFHAKPHDSEPRISIASEICKSKLKIGFKK